MKIINGLPPESSAPVGLDIELFQFDKHKPQRPFGKFACMTLSFDGKTAYFIDDVKDIPKALKRLRGEWRIHNAIFDLSHLRRWANINHTNVWDTFTIEKELYSAYYERFGLEDLYRRYFNKELPKELQKSFEKANELTPEQKQYAANDACAHFLVGEKQHALTPRPNKIYEQIDRPILFSIMDFEGMYVDQKSWLLLAEENAQTAEKIKNGLGFNPGSWQQALLQLRKAGIRVSSTSESVLEEHKGHPLVDAILEYRTYAKRSGTYGKKFLEEHLEADGRIHPAYKVCGAETGRTSSTDPNFQNIPARDTKRFRECFTAAPKRKLIIADYSQQEPRINAFYIQDPTMMKIFRQRGDIYINLAQAVFGEAIVKGDRRRKEIKERILAIAYGMTAKGLALKEGITESEATIFLNRYFMIFPKQFSHIEETKRLQQEWVTTAAGRKIWINFYVRTWLNSALNAPVQGGAADCSKVAGILIQREIRRQGIDAKIVNFVHDEFVVEASRADAKQTAKIVHDCMVNAAEEMFSGIPFEVDTYIGDRWSDKDDEAKKVHFPH